MNTSESQGEHAQEERQVKFQEIATHRTEWKPSDAKVTLNIRLDGCIVPSIGPAGARVSYSHVVVLDEFVDDISREELLLYLSPVSSSDSILPESIWDRKTSDMAGADPTWGVHDEVIETLQKGQLNGVIEIQSRLQKLYPEYRIAFLPSSDIQLLSPEKAKSANCTSILVNAATQYDSFKYHVDADPTSFPTESAWVKTYGDYFNGEDGKPLLVSLIVYLNGDWDANWAADTLVLDSGTECGVFIRPKPGRVVIMDQDAYHRISPPSAFAEGKPRYSIVWKLVFIPREDVREMKKNCICRPEWGMPTSFGSAAKVESVMRKIYHQNKS